MTAFQRHVTCLLLIFGTGSAVAHPLQAQTFASSPNWWAVGSTGIADESAASQVSFNGAAVGLRSTAPVNTVAVVRYPVSLVPSLLLWHTYFNQLVAVGLPRLTLAMSFAKNDDGAYVSATLKRVRLEDGVETAMTGVNTLSSVPGTSQQTLTRTIDCGEACVNPELYAYYVEVVVWNAYSTSRPQMFTVRVNLLRASS